MSKTSNYFGIKEEQVTDYCTNPMEDDTNSNYSF